MFWREVLGMRLWWVIWWRDTFREAKGVGGTGHVGGGERGRRVCVYVKS
jgi:hypothetical protein